MLKRFEGIFCRVIVTADDKQTVREAAEDATATPSVVIGRVEGGVERWLSKKETPDKRKGAVLQFWGQINPKKTFAESLKKFETELSYRIRQDILVKPFTAVYDALPNAEGKTGYDDARGALRRRLRMDRETARARSHRCAVDGARLRHRTLPRLCARRYGRELLDNVPNQRRR